MERFYRLYAVWFCLLGEKKMHRFRIVAVAALSTLLPVSAQAHHFMDGSVPQTLFEGFLSGLAHPVIGPEHLGFIIAMALAAAAARRIVLVPLVFVLATAVGCAVHLGGGPVPGGEPAAIAAALFAGALLAIAWHRTMPGLWVAFAAVGGVIHGHAYGAAIVGAEPAPVGSYLAGFAVVQAVLCCGGAYAISRILRLRGDLGGLVFRSGGVGVGMLAVLVAARMSFGA